MTNNLDGAKAGLALETRDIDENAWRAWLEKGRKQDRKRLQRLKATAFVSVILVSFAIIWIYLPR